MQYMGRQCIVCMKILREFAYYHICLLSKPTHKLLELKYNSTPSSPPLHNERTISIANEESSGGHREGVVIVGCDGTISREQKYVGAYEWSEGKGVTIPSQYRD